MKVLAVMGSPKGKGNTYRLTQMVEEHMKRLGDVEFEYLFLKDINLGMCKGCYQCLARGEDKCPLKDDRAMIEQKMAEADGVIFASPTYIMNVSGLFKNFADRFAYVCHRPRFFKPAIAVSTTGGIGAWVIAIIIGYTVNTWGFNVCARLGAITPPFPEDERHGNIEKQKKKAVRDSEKSARRFYAAIIKKDPPSPGIIDLVKFKLQKSAFGRKGKLATDFDYWNDNGWLNKKASFYYDAKVNPVKKFAAWLILKLMGDFS